MLTHHSLAMLKRRTGLTKVRCVERTAPWYQCFRLLLNRHGQWIPAFAGVTRSGGWGVEKQPCLYIFASRWHGTLYTGVASSLPGRLSQHREKIIPGFPSKHDIARLVWFEVQEDMRAAILREKPIKKWNRDWKLTLIERTNPQWLDLAIGLGFEPPRTVNGK